MDPIKEPVVRKLFRHSRQILGRLTYGKVVATVAVLLALSTGTAWALEVNSVGTNHVRDFTLNDQDVGQGAFVNFEASIGTVPANDCVFGKITGVKAGGDHLLLTPSAADVSFGLVYSVRYTPAVGDGAVNLETCNVRDFPVNDGTTHFNLLVIDAQ